MSAATAVGWSASLNGVLSATPAAALAPAIKSAQQAVVSMSVLPAETPAATMIPVDAAIQEGGAAFFNDGAVEAAATKSDQALILDSHKLRLLKMYEGRLSAEDRARLQATLDAHDSRLELGDRRDELDARWSAVNEKVNGILRELYGLDVDPWLAPRATAGPAPAAAAPASRPFVERKSAAVWADSLGAVFDKNPSSMPRRWRDVLPGFFQTVMIPEPLIRSAQESVLSLSVLPVDYRTETLAPLDAKIREAAEALLQEASVAGAAIKNTKELIALSQKLRLLKSLSGRLTPEGRERLKQALEAYDRRLAPYKREQLDAQWREVDEQIEKVLQELRDLNVDPWIAPRSSRDRSTSPLERVRATASSGLPSVGRL